MSRLNVLLATALLAVSASVAAQVEVPRDPGSYPKVPGQSDVPVAPDAGTRAPSGSGMVVVPPKTGTEGETVVKPPKEVDPGILSPPETAERQNPKESEGGKRAPAQPK